MYVLPTGPGLRGTMLLRLAACRIDMFVRQRLLQVVRSAHEWHLPLQVVKSVRGGVMMSKPRTCNTAKTPVTWGLMTL